MLLRLLTLGLIALASCTAVADARPPPPPPHSGQHQPPRLSDQLPHHSQPQHAYTGHHPHLADPSSGRARTSDNVRVDRKTDCALKAFALRYATEVLQASPNTQAAVHDGLELGSECGMAHPFEGSTESEQQRYSRFFPSQLKWDPATTFNSQKADAADSKHGRRKSQQRGGAKDAPLLDLFVDGTHGSDSNPGTESSPLQSFNQALRLLRFARPASGPIADLEAYPASITFRAGAYFFSGPVELSERDSFLTIQAYPGEEVLFSGGLDLSQLEWSTYAGPILQAQLPAGACTAASCFNEMYLGGRRAIRARFPNGNPETAGLWTVNNTGYIPAAAAWLPPWPQSLPTTIALASPTRNSKNFPAYQLGVGGAANAFTPPTSFWATLAPPAGNTYTVPGGLVFVNSTWSGRTYKDPSIALIHTFHGAYWGNWIFSVGAIKEVEQTIQFSGGGFQEARGTTMGAEWYIENLLEELDSEEEWWVDASKGILYFYPNSTKLERVASETKAEAFKLRARDGDSNPLSLVGTQTDSILTLSGSSEKRLLQSVVISGLTFAHTASTFMQDMEVPSGGDWTLLRVGAVKFENSRDSVVQGCAFRGMGGNGVVISGANINTTVAFNEFVWIGSSAVLVAGRTEGIDGASRMLHAQGTTVRGNLMHEIGIWVKQSSAVGVALAKSMIIDSNIVFNIARAGLNFNDGFGGGHYVTHNLIFNAVRETDDHGPINTWDRQPYLTTVSTPPSDAEGGDDGSDTLSGSSTFTASLHPAESYIHHNFLVCNYMSLWPLDHDDGSSFWTDTQNYMIYGGYKSYLGNSLTVSNNFYVLPDGKVDAVAEQHKHHSALRAAGVTDPQVLQSVPPALEGLSSIMHRRADNLRNRYHIGQRGLEVRDKALKAGSSIEEALKLQADLERSLRLEDDLLQLQAFTGGTMCCEDGGGYGHAWTNNTCTVLDVLHVYNLWACNLLSLPTSIPFLAFNSLHAAGDLAIACGNSNLTIPEMQKLGYEWGTVQSPPADLATMLQWGETLFGMQPGATALGQDTDRAKLQGQRAEEEEESLFALI